MVSRPGSSSVPSSLRVTVPADVLYQQVNGETVLLDLRGERYYSLDDTGTLVWSLLAEHGHAGTVCARLLALYDVDETKLREDVGRFISMLAEKGLVRVEEVGSGSVTGGQPV